MNELIGLPRSWIRKANLGHALETWVMLELYLIPLLLPTR